MFGLGWADDECVWTRGQVIAPNKVEAGCPNQIPDGRLPQMLNPIAIRGPQIGAHTVGIDADTLPPNSLWQGPVINFLCNFIVCLIGLPMVKNFKVFCAALRD
jgi:hypothetical protein